MKKIMFATIVTLSATSAFAGEVVQQFTNGQKDLYIQLKCDDNLVPLNEGKETKLVRTLETIDVKYAIYFGGVLAMTCNKVESSAPIKAIRLTDLKEYNRSLHDWSESLKLLKDLKEDKNGVYSYQFGENYQCEAVVEVSFTTGSFGGVLFPCKNYDMKTAVKGTTFGLFVPRTWGCDVDDREHPEAWKDEVYNEFITAMGSIAVTNDQLENRSMLFKLKEKCDGLVLKF